MSSSLTDSLRETLALFEGEDAGTPRTTSEVAEALDLGRRSTYERLQRLVEHDRIETKKVGARGRVWWRPVPVADEGSDDGDAVVSRLIDNVPGMVYRCRNEPGWPMSFVSDAASDLTGYDPDDIEAGEVSWGEDVVHLDDRDSLRETVQRQLADGDRFTVEYRIVTADGGERWVREQGCAVDDADGRQAVLEGVVTDVTDEVRSKRALAERERQFRSLVEATEEYAIFRLDADGHVQTWNPGAERIKGYGREEIVGEHFSAFYTEEDRAAGLPEENLAAAAANGVTEDEGWRVRADGSRFWANVTITAVRDEDGDLRGFAKVTRDMTDRRQREQAVRHERNILAQVLDVSPIGIGVFDDRGDPLRVNEQFTTLLGAPGDDPEGYVLGTQSLLDEAGEEIPYEERPAPRVLSTGDPVHDQRVRVDGPDRRTRWLSVNAEPLDEADGVVVTMTDVSRLKEQADRLERQRDDMASEIEDVFERVDDGFFALDRGLTFTYVNDRAGDMLDHVAGELVGEHIWEVFEPGAKAEAAFAETLATQEPASFEEYYDPLDTWFETHVYPSETGLSVYFQDVSERKRRERDLERYERIVETVDDGIYLLDDDHRFRMVNDAFVALAGYDREQLLGAHAELVFGDKYIEIAEAKQTELEADETAVAVVEEELYPADADSLIVESRFTLFEFENGTMGRVGAVRDVTDRVERERDLEQYETILETMEDGVYVVDADGRFSVVNDAYAGMVGYDREELLGMTAADLVDEETATQARAAHRELASGAADTARLQTELETPDGTLVAEATFALIDADGDGPASRVAVVRDVTERRERERDLERYERIVETVGDGIYAVDSDARFTLVNDALCEMTGYDREELLGADATVLYDDEVGARVADIAAAVVAGERDVGAVEFDLLTRGDVSVPVETRFAPVRVGDDHGRCGVVRDITERLEREDELERQREQLAALNNLHGVVRRINEAVIEQSTQAEVERVVVETLADSDSYQFAWVADADRYTGEVSVRVEAGVENYLDDLALTLDDDGPTSRAFRTQEVHAVNDIETDDSYVPWRDWAADHAYQSSAAIPIVHDGTAYGVLNVYADRRDAFTAAEREVVGQLGEIVGHAIASVERKQALMSDEVVEIEFRIPDIFDEFGLPEVPDGDIVLEETVTVGDGTFLEYGTATGDAMTVVEALVASSTVPHWTALNVLGEDDDGTRFELMLTEPPVLSKLANHGGYVHEATIADGVYSMRVHLAPSSDVRTVIDAIEDAYPSIQMVTRRQVSRDRESRERLARTVLDDLTDRQRTALEAAYYSGFFEWPRDSSGEDVAESLGITAPTFHQHLRKAQQQVVAAALNG